MANDTCDNFKLLGYFQNKPIYEGPHDKNFIFNEIQQGY
jgi:hypothetical protein